MKSLYTLILLAGAIFLFLYRKNELRNHHRHTPYNFDQYHPTDALRKNASFRAGQAIIELNAEDYTVYTDEISQSKNRKFR